MNDLHIRTAREADLPDMDRLFRETLRSVNARDYTPAQIEAWSERATPGRWQELFHGPLRFLVAERGGLLAGFAAVDPGGWLHSLFTGARFQRQGVAAALLREAAAYAAVCGARRLAADVSITARPFFERSGFRVASVNDVAIGGVRLTNFRMEKEIADGSIRFRSALPADRESILLIIRQAQERMRAAGSLQWQDGYPAPADIERDTERGYGHVLCREAATIAYGAIAFDGEPAYERIEGAWLGTEPYAVVHRLAVADGACKQGVATLFMRHAEELARQRGVSAMRVDTNFDNLPMLRMLPALGYIRCGEVSYRNAPRIAFEKIL